MVKIRDMCFNRVGLLLGRGSLSHWVRMTRGFKKFQNINWLILTLEFQRIHVSTSCSNSFNIVLWNCWSDLCITGLVVLKFGVVVCKAWPLECNFEITLYWYCYNILITWITASYMTNIHFLQCVFHYPVNILLPWWVTICKGVLYLGIISFAVSELLSQHLAQDSESLRPPPYQSTSPIMCFYLMKS